MVLTLAVFVRAMHAAMRQEVARILAWGDREGKTVRRGQQAPSTQSGSERRRCTDCSERQRTETYSSAVNTIVSICECCSIEFSLNDAVVFGTPACYVRILL